MSGSRHRGSLGETLRTARVTAFVGREAELARFQTLLADPGPALVWVSAAGGTGKTTLLARWEELARGAGAACYSIDLAQGEASPSAILTELEPIAHSDARAVVLLDSYEQAAALDGWVRQTLLVALPADVIVVIGSRQPPSVEWRTDPGTSSILHAVELANFDDQTSRALLAGRGVGEDRIETLVQLSHGHALALVLLAAVQHVHGPALDSLRAAPNVVGELVARFVRGIDSDLERRALEVVAHARTTKADLLHAVLGERAHDLLTWLRALPFTTTDRDGVRLHPIVRDAVDEDLRWRDPQRYRALHLAIASELVDRVLRTSDSERERAFLDLLYLRRVGPLARRLFDFETLGSGWADTPTVDERATVLALVERHEGPDAAAIAAYWFDRQREAFTVLRSPLGDPIVVSLHLVLGALDRDACQLDPALAAIESYLATRGGLHAGESIVISRFALGTDPTSDGRLRHFRPMLLWLTVPEVAFAFTALSDGERWAAACAEANHHRVASFTLAGRTAPIYVGDLRKTRPRDWLMQLLERDLRERLEWQAAPHAATDVALDRAQTGEAVRHALENFTRPDLLAANPLLRSQALRRRAEPGTVPSPALLRRVIAEAIATLADHPRDAKLARALDVTYVHPAPTRELAAARLDIPYSTFRRHLSRALERLAEVFWSMEA